MKSAGGLGDANCDFLRKERLRSTGWVLICLSKVGKAVLVGARYLGAQDFLHAQGQIKDWKEMDGILLYLLLPLDSN